uniref:DNA polymerase II large subunit,DNA polymerase II large subunit n=1 Tax=Pyrococcus abyssi TaxID=29292 RepID=UPI000003472B|nr:Chain B, DNA polymerase II large subunit,DNA polymerase II large subunit [Pyrococcus abyssi]8PPT_B Chain B, DP2 [Pyrococcus abyssi GE5]8PPU_B Chain B, DP2 [Pyrococcus abyssi GE5]8PPV_B Chain B, DP2 [Pyrococcus abyssi GE5]
MELPKEMEEYFEMLQREIDKAYEIAKKARAQGKDPSLDVEIPQATDMAGRVESLVGPPGVAKRIRELVKEYGKEIAALKIVDEIIEGKFGDLGSREKYAEQAVRTALAILTEGIVSAPIEGIANVKIKRNTWADNSEYLALYYAGPIRSSGGTAQALSVLVGDYVRRKLGLDRFKPSEKHIERMVEEVDLYHRAVTRLQYHPSPEEVRLAMRNIPIEITGEATDDVEVSHRDVPGVETNQLRGGAILVLAEGVLQKAKKLVKYIDKMGIEGWEWLKEFVEAKEKGEPKEEGKEESLAESTLEETKVEVDMGFYYSLYQKFKEEIAPSDKYAKEVIGGRPLFSDPSKPGGFRLRYGRSRASGFATWGINPATMILVDEFLAIGTQLKTERPGKGAVVTPVTTIEGPIVKLKDGSVLRVDDYNLALKVREDVEEILYLGDAVIAFGDFVENNQTLLPANYCEEWWILEFVKALKEIYEVHLEPFTENEEESIEEASDYLEIDPEFLKEMLRDPLRVKPPVELAIHFSEVLGIPLHPYYTLYWNSVEPKDVEKLWRLLKNYAEIEWSNFRGIKFAKKIVISQEKLGDSKRTLELLGLPHTVRDGNVIVDYPWAAALLTPLGNLNWEFMAKPLYATIDIINENNEIKLRDRGISWIGARMGRPEKAKERKMKPPVQVLFPIGLAGGSSRDIKKAAEEGKVAEVEIAFFKCPKCGHVGPEHLCPNCGTRKELLWVCPRCNAEYPESQAEGYNYTCPKCNVKLRPYAKRKIRPSELLNRAMENVKVYGVDKLKGVMGMTSGWKMPEPLEKGLLRAKNDVYVFKDGTIRFDATDAPITHFRPREIGVSVEKLRELGYTHDFEGKPLVSEDQIVELKPQDIILSKEAGRYLLKVAKFVDDLLEKFYGLPRFYNAEKMEDLIGHLVIGLAPHTSAGIVGRIIGFVDALVGYAHPYFHAAKRRNCDGDEDAVMLLLDALLNFSRYYLPEKRGGKMDAPLVITTRLDPREVDSEVHNMDIVRYYPLEFYEATYELKSPKELVGVIERVEDRLGKPEMYYGLKFTHDTDDIALGPKMSLYKQLGDMEEKVRRQLEVAKRIRAVDEHGVAEKILNSHLIPDLRGNLRSFTRQEFRCVKCNTKFRRPPLNGKCPVCGGKIVLTVSKGAIEKYLGTAKMLVTEYNVKNYTRQRICLTERDIDSLFENVFPETQLTLIVNPNDICQRLVMARTGEVNKSGLLENLSNGSKKTEKAEKAEKPRKKSDEKPKKKRVISLEEFFSRKSK